MLFFKDNELIYTENESDIAYYALLAELNLFLYENDMDISAGMDYKAILNKEKFLKTELNRVCEKHKDNFASFEIGEPIQEGEGISCKISLQDLSGNSQSINIVI